MYYFITKFHYYPPWGFYIILYYIGKNRKQAGFELIATAGCALLIFYALFLFLYLCIGVLTAGIFGDPVKKKASFPQWKIEKEKAL